MLKMLRVILLGLLIVVVKKADGGWRLCTDFRKLNAVTEPDPFPLPRIDDLLDKYLNTS